LKDPEEEGSARLKELLGVENSEEVRTKGSRQRSYSSYSSSPTWHGLLLLASAISLLFLLMKKNYSAPSGHELKLNT
jgi:hypothetical protein